jgi:hypothetical protein
MKEILARNYKNPANFYSYFLLDIDLRNGLLLVGDGAQMHNKKRLLATDYWVFFTCILATASFGMVSGALGISASNLPECSCL